MTASVLSKEKKRKQEKSRYTNNNKNTGKSEDYWFHEIN